MKNVRILGTSHIAKQSIQEITHAIGGDKPEIVALELDIQRAAALLEGTPRKISPWHIGRIGLKGYLFARIGQAVQQRLGRVVGVAPGSEMKTALELARKHKIQMELIDQPIAMTLRALSKSLTWREKWRFGCDLLYGLLFPRQQMKEYGLEQFDLHKVPEAELIHKMMGQLKRRFPSVYRTLVEDRNKYMVRKIVGLLRQHPGKKILVIVGAGHKEGMEELLLKVDVVG